MDISSMKTSFEKDTTVTATYEEAILFYNQLSEQSPLVHAHSFGETDSGFPLHEVLIAKESTPEEVRNSGKVILMINNAIHPGEPCGVDASMMLARDLVMQESLKGLLNHVAVVIVPVYNIGGSLNRGPSSRANQNGPQEYGFRGNAKNLDLNRDFIKCDSKNARSFNQLFNKWKPDVFIDNHTSNGADYQYVMTLIATQKDRLPEPIRNFMTNQMLPYLYDKMEDVNYEMTPYVYARSTPDQGIYGFLDSPRYSSGYAALHHTISFMPETHMLKPYQDRVKSTYHFSRLMLQFMKEQKDALIKAKHASIEEAKLQNTYDLTWSLDRSRVDTFIFKGYEAKYKPSAVTGHSRLYYDHDSPYEKEILYYNSYKPSLSVAVPKAYVVPQAYSEIIERLKWNSISFKIIDKDTLMDVEVYKVIDFETTSSAYEGHYLHSNVNVDKTKEKLLIRKGDVWVDTHQDGIRYIMETLEPQAPDGFFAWNFFDGILMQKEHFSSYVFEEIAEELLQRDDELRKAFTDKKATDPQFEADAAAQLNFIYERSEHYEPTHRRFPILRVN